MKTTHIIEKLETLGVSKDAIIKGDFDYIGEYTAKRSRNPDDPNFKHGAFYRSNYERGILIYNLIRKFDLDSFLEIGFGRGYGTFCAAKAFYDSGKSLSRDRIITIDPALEKKNIETLQGVFPSEWFDYISFYKGMSRDVLPTLAGKKFGLVYIDGDHSYVGTKSDWEMTKDLYDKFMLFDDYHLPSKVDKGTIECSRLIDEIDYKIENCNEPELIILDRRIFHDDRGVPDDQVNYGQVLFTKAHVKSERNDW